MIRLTALFATMFLPALSMAQTQTLSLRAGEHNNFTRVVLPLPNELGWTLGRTTNGYGLRLSRPVSIDDSNFFSIIPRDRIADVTISDNQTDVSFELACQCSAVAFTTDTGWLVIDISNAPPAQDSEFEQLVFQDDRIETASYNRPKSRPKIGDPIEANIASDQDQELPITFETDGTTAIQQIDNLPDQFEEVQRLQQLENAIADSLSRAVSQGLLEPAELQQANQLEDEEQELRSLLTDVAALTGPGIHSRTSIDLEALFGTNVPDETANSHVCIVARDLNINDWATEVPFVEQLADRRNSLVGEFDRPISGAVDDLARLYLHFGFGREAILALNIEPIVSADRSTLISLAEIMDGDPVSDTDFVHNMNCSAPADFWGLIAHQEGALPYPIDPNSITDTFRSLPPHLQKLLAPTVSAKLRAAGEPESARIVLGVSLIDSKDAEKSTLEEAELLLAFNNEPMAREHLEELTNNDGRADPYALLQLYELKLSNNEIITDTDLSDLRSIMYEQSETATVSKLLEMEIRVLNHMGRHLEAFDKIQDANERLQNDVTTELKTDTITRLIDNASEIEFLTFVFDTNIGDSSAEVQNLAANRLVDLGFLDRASELIANQTIGAWMTERRYIRAEISARQGNFDLTRAHLLGLSSPRTSEIFAILGTEEQMQDQSGGLLAEGNVPISDPDDGASSDISSISARQNPAPRNEGSLSEGQRLISTSLSLRDDVSDLLSQFDID